MLVSLAASLVLLELGATLALGKRFARGVEFGNTWKFAGRLDPDLGWSGRPGATGRVTDGKLDYAVELNSQGFRDPERTLAKPPGTKRVLALGDSVTWGWGVEFGQRFTDLLEQRLGPGVEVLNLACPGYGTDQQYWTLIDRGLAYDPDLVLVCFIANDVPEAKQNERYDMRKPRFVRADDGKWRVEGRPIELQDNAFTRWRKDTWRALVVHSALLSLVTRRTLDPPARVEEGQAQYQRPTPKMLAPVRALAEELLDPQSVSRHALGLLRDACEERGIPLLITHVPHKHDQYLYEPRFPAPLDLGPSPHRTYLTQCLQSACTALGLPLIPVDEAYLQAAQAGTNLHVGDGHPNGEGHRIIADALEPALRALLGIGE
jgi:lysophospholipase L1-like esterase